MTAMTNWQTSYSMFVLMMPTAVSLLAFIWAPLLLQPAAVSVVFVVFIIGLQAVLFNMIMLFTMHRMYETKKLKRGSLQAYGLAFVNVTAVLAIQCTWILLLVTFKDWRMADRWSIPRWIAYAAATFVSTLLIGALLTFSFEVARVSTEPAAEQPNEDA